MSSFVRREAKTLVVAVVVSMLTAGVTSLLLGGMKEADAHGAEHSQFAHDAGKLGGSGPKSFVRSNDVLWAAVNEGGNLRRGKGAVRARKETPSSTGQYFVKFNRKVHKCAWQATISGETDSNYGLVEVEPAAIGPKWLFVYTLDHAGGPSDRGFSLLVTC